MKIILAVQDTTELNYTTLDCTDGLGPYGGSENSKGLIMHTTLAVTTEGVSLGILEQNIWARDPKERGKSHKCSKYPIEQKESYKWLRSMENNRKGVPQDVEIVNVCDRDADLYEFLYKGVTEKSSFVVRARQNRIIKEEDKKLYNKLEKLPVEGEIFVDIPRDSRKKVPIRKTCLGVKFSKVNIAAPRDLPAKYKEVGSLSLYVVLKVNKPSVFVPLYSRLTLA